MLNRLKLPLFILIVVFGSCSRQKDLEVLTETVCRCSEPVLAWRDKLPSNPGSINHGAEINQALRDCLKQDAALFQTYASDTAFVYDLAERVNATCPRSNATLNAILLIWAGNK